METLTLALDWTPNTNHIGFFIAQEKGFYEEEKLDVRILDPATDDYTETPAKKVELGKADFALCPTESILSYRTKTEAFPLLALATILQKDLSAIVVRADASIMRPSDLDGKSYASYQARYEDEIVRSMIRNDGGKGTIEVKYPNKLGIWDTLLSNTYDATWIFLNWEALQVEATPEHSLRTFTLADYGIPYSYSPVIAASQTQVKAKHSSYEHFLKATKKGYLYAQEHQAEAVELFRPFVPQKDEAIDLAKSLAMTDFGTSETWGKMQPEMVLRFSDWLHEKGLEKRKFSLEELVCQDLNF